MGACLESNYFLETEFFGARETVEPVLELERVNVLSLDLVLVVSRTNHTAAGLLLWVCVGSALQGEHSSLVSFSQPETVLDQFGSHFGVVEAECIVTLVRVHLVFFTDLLLLFISHSGLNFELLLVNLELFKSAELIHICFKVLNFSILNFSLF
jgi:hypothetical protein